MKRISAMRVGDGWAAHCAVCDWRGTNFPENAKALADREVDGHLCPRLDASMMSDTQIRLEAARRKLVAPEQIRAEQQLSEMTNDRDRWRVLSDDLDDRLSAARAEAREANARADSSERRAAKLKERVVCVDASWEVRRHLSGSDVTLSGDGVEVRIPVSLARQVVGLADE